MRHPFRRILCITFLLLVTTSAPSFSLTWKITDLGGVEADSSYVPMVVNNRGSAAYVQWIEGSDPRVILHQEGTLYGVTIRNLGTVTKLNDNGCFSGYLFLPDNMMQGFLFCDGQLETFGQGVEFIEVTDLNNRNEVLGSYTFNSEQGYTPYIYRNGAMLDLPGFPPGFYSTPMAMNDQGMVVGSMGDPSTGFGNAFIVQNGALTRLDTLGGDYGSAWAVNGQGHVIGTADDAMGMGQAFLCQDGRTLIPLADGAYYSYANDINNRGTVVGEWALMEGRWNGFVYRDGRFMDVPPPNGSSVALVHVNDNDIALGYMTNMDQGMDTVMLYSDQTGLVPLGDLVVNGQGWEFLSAEGIGDDNTIIGLALYRGGTHVYMLTPAD